MVGVTGAGCVVVVVGAASTLAVSGALVVGVTGAGAVVVVVATTGALYATRCDGRFTLSNGECDVERACADCAPSTCDGTDDADATPVACVDPFCSKRRGTPNRPPQRTAATPRRLP